MANTARPHRSPNVTNDGGKDVTNDVTNVTNVTNNGGNGDKEDMEIDLIQFVYNSMAENNHITLSELANFTHTSERHIKRIIKRLKEDGYLTRQGSPRTGKWVVLNNAETLTMK